MHVRRAKGRLNRTFATEFVGGGYGSKDFGNKAYSQYCFLTLKEPVRQTHARNNQKHMEVPSLLEPATEALPDSQSMPALYSLNNSSSGNINRIQPKGAF